MDKSYIGKTAMIIDDPLDKGLEAIILDYHEADNTCDIKVLLPGDRKRIRKIHGECLLVKEPEEESVEHIRNDPGVFEAEQILSNAMVQKREEPSVRLPGGFRADNTPTENIVALMGTEEAEVKIAEMFIEALKLFIEKHKPEPSKPVKGSWHP